MNILVVEDDFIARKFMATVLSEYGNVDIATDGIEGIKLFKNAFNTDKKYGLVCLDIMMPDIDGQEVLKTIRQIEYENNIFGSKATKVIMTTALRDVENVSKAFKEQAEAYLVKPISIEDIKKALKDIGIGE